METKISFRELAKDEADLEQIYAKNASMGNSGNTTLAYSDVVDESDEYFAQYKMTPESLQSSKAWSAFYETEDLLDFYLEKEGQSFETHPEAHESDEYFEQYKMKEQSDDANKAWYDFYETEDLLDAYLEKQGYA